jgi:hypothetical protein
VPPASQVSVDFFFNRNLERKLREKEQENEKLLKSKQSLLRTIHFKNRSITKHKNKLTQIKDQKQQKDAETSRLK